MKKQMTKIGYLRENPDATFEEYEKATGGTKLSYTQNKYLIKTQKEYAVNLLKSVNKTKPDFKPVKKAKRVTKKKTDILIEHQRTIENLKTEVASVRNACSEFHAENKALNGLITKMEDDIKMYIAIISYLEHKLGIPDANEL